MKRSGPGNVMRRKEQLFRRVRVPLLIVLAAGMLVAAGWLRANAPPSPVVVFQDSI